MTTDFGDRGAPPRRGDGTMLAFVLALVVVLVLAVGGMIGATGQWSDMIAQGSGGYARLLGSVAGGSFMLAGFVWAVLYVSFVHRREPHRGPAYFFGLLGAAVLPQLAWLLLINTFVVEGHARAEQEKIAQAEISAAYEKLYAINAGGPMTVIETPVRAKGAAGEVERLTKSFIGQNARDHVAFRDEIAALGYPDLLQPRRLARDPGLVRTRAALATAMERVQHYRDLQATRFDEYRATVESSSLSRRDREDFLRGMDEGGGGRSADHQWALQERALNNIDIAMAVLQRSRGRWQIRNNQIYFNRDSDLAAFRAAADRAAAAENEMTALADAAARRTRSMLAGDRRAGGAPAAPR
ncbi:MAG TPA: hypothetical protein VEA15_11045 [Caulobacteraceae bacterium]|nr:hypothetical protein [Caulobacteraceae bacterium]